MGPDGPRTRSVHGAALLNYEGRIDSMDALEEHTFDQARTYASSTPIRLFGVEYAFGAMGSIDGPWIFSVRGRALSCCNKCSRDRVSEGSPFIMRVLLVGPYLADGQYSIPAFVSVLKHGLTTHGISVKSCFPKVSRAGTALRPILGRRSAFFDKFLAFPSHLRRLSKECDLVHIAEHGYVSYCRHINQKPHVVTCHDLIVAKAMLGEIEDWPLSLPAKKYQQSILSNLKLAQHVAAVSVSTRQDVIRLSNRSESDTSLIYNGFYRQMKRLSDVDAARALKQLPILPGKHWLLHIGGNQPNKNKAGVLEIFAELQQRDDYKDLGLVMAGAAPTRETIELAAKCPNPAKVVFIERPTDEQVCALYSLAMALLFPSTYEGFGLPIIEAQRCGCPVITTNAPPMNDVGGDAAIYIDPKLTYEAAVAIAAALPQIGDLVDSGITNTQRFSAERMCTAYAKLYGELI